MATIYIDNTPHEIADGQNLLQACLALGYDLPYFCWHPAMGSVGACRQCAVKQFKDGEDRQGKLVMACMTPAEDGTRISIDDPEARQFRAAVIQWLMLNHPHDCPVCDEGGECHLQDMTVMTGHNYRSIRFPKRTYRNQELGPFLNHEMNRCIQCYRCVRFYQDHAGGSDLSALGAHDHVYFGRFGHGPLENEFSGNLVEICPTGVFTDKSFKAHFTRKWDLQSAPAVCVHCGLGCNIIAGERYGSLRRVRNRYHHQVNGYFLCDRGRFGYAFVNSGRRVRDPLYRSPGEDNLHAVTGERALELAAAMLADSDRVIGIGSPRATLEGNYALRALAGADGFYAGLAAGQAAGLNTGLDILRQGPVPAATLQDVARSDAALVLGEDVTQTAPLTALSLRSMGSRRAARKAADFHVPGWNAAAVGELAQLQNPDLFLATPCPTRLDDAAEHALRAAPDDLVRLGWAVLAAMDPDRFAMPDTPESIRVLARRAARALMAADRPLVVTGTGCGLPDMIEAAANVAWCLHRKGRRPAFSLCVPEANSLGLALMEARDLNAAFKAVAAARTATVIVLENDLYRRAPVGRIDALLQKARHVIVIDCLSTATTEKADLVLPAATFAEAGGTLVNNEGRAQRSHAVMPADGEVRAGWRWLRALMTADGRAPSRSWQGLADVWADLAAALPVFGPAAELDAVADLPAPGGRIPRQSHRYSGRTAMGAHIEISEPQPPADVDSPLAFSMEGYAGQPPAGLIPRLWAPGWNSVQALNKFQSEIGGPLRGGEPGRRLVEPPESDHGRFFDRPSAPAELQDGEFILVPVHHIFGSDLLSMAAPAIAQRAPRPYLALDPSQAPAGDGGTVRLQTGSWTLELPIKLVPGMPPRTAGLPAGIPGLPVMDLPAVGKITVVETRDEE
jgi:NADH-quinone oxidoreductase subunit G